MDQNVALTSKLSPRDIREMQERRLLTVARRQHGLITRSQAVSLGFKSSWLGRRLAQGRLIRVHESVYRLASHPLTWHHDLLAACFAGGQQRQSVVSFRSALQISALPGGAEIVEITSPRHRRARHAGVITHESRILEDRDIWYVGEIPVTRAARTLCDVAGLVVLREFDSATLELAVMEAMRLGLVDRTTLESEWRRLGGVRRLGGGVIERMLATLTPPARAQDSRPEVKALLAIRAAGLPEPVPQHRLWVSPTEHVRFDLAWPELKYAWEVSPWWYHGGTRERHDRDGHRRLLVRAAGWDYDVATDVEIDNGFPIILEILRNQVRR
jgi:hypothetical protein